MDLLFENSEDKQDVESDWYRESDTGDEIPDPYMQEEPLYQKSANFHVEFVWVILKKG